MSPSTHAVTTEKEDKNKGANPIIAIAIAILIAFTISGIGLIVFLQSDTRETVRLIQQQSDSVVDSQDGTIDTTSLPSAEEIENIKNDIESTLNGLPPAGTPEEFSDQSLGL